MIDQQNELRPCPSCGEEVRRHAMTCPKCGQKLSGLEKVLRVALRDAWANGVGVFWINMKWLFWTIVIGGIVILLLNNNPFDIPSDYFDNKQQETPIKRPR